MQRAWLLLIVAGTFEVVWAICLKHSDGFRRTGWATFTVMMMAASFYFLAQALKSLPVGTAYPIWTGIGAVGTAIVGMLVFGESRDIFRIISIALIVVGIVGLKLASE